MSPPLIKGGPNDDRGPYTLNKRIAATVASAFKFAPRPRTEPLCGDFDRPHSLTPCKKEFPVLIIVSATSDQMRNTAFLVGSAHPIENLNAAAEPGMWERRLPRLMPAENETRLAGTRQALCQR